MSSLYTSKSTPLFKQIFTLYCLKRWGYCVLVLRHLKELYLFTESISHSYAGNERHNTAQSIPLPIDYEVISSNYDKNYTHSHTMSAPYEHQYDVINKQANENLKQQCEKALHDLNQLRRQHTETTRRCEHVMKVSS